LKNEPLEIDEDVVVDGTSPDSFAFKLAKK
jgi:hypothetical protein